MIFSAVQDNSTEPQPDPAGLLPYKDQPPRRFRVRTVLFPLLFLGLHWLIANVAATVYLVVYVFLQGNTVNPLEILGDTGRLQQILTEQYPIISVIYAGVLIPFYFLFLYVQKGRDSRAVLLDRPTLKGIFPAVAMMVGALGLTNIWFNLLTMWSEHSDSIHSLLDDYSEQAGAFGPETSYFWLILGISIMAPIAEELLFRGIIQGELRRAMPEWAAILIQGLIFALFHMQPIQISYVILPGMLLGIAYAWTGSLWVPIVMHISFNFLGSVLPSLVGNDEILSNILGISEMGFILVGILSFIYLYRNYRSNQRAAKSTGLSGHFYSGV
ncbi:MAG: CPBP family intramembrane glutamic endopeptidase [Clostridiaceae bacterium]|nr:CPBP family intramembrane glutamic endopeptidase [Clostridiaceae bacterium]